MRMSTLLSNFTFLTVCAALGCIPLRTPLRDKRRLQLKELSMVPGRIMGSRVTVASGPVLKTSRYTTLFAILGCLYLHACGNIPVTAAEVLAAELANAAGCSAVTRNVAVGHHTSRVELQDIGEVVQRCGSDLCFKTLLGAAAQFSCVLEVSRGGT
ncbi:hypothetical protein EDB89DRAFT_1907943 [Lactarius sanguifluus]|nr:hypothetical protein EDB89DRAFT_1907943 [Lactarius sanguifluus]